MTRPRTLVFLTCIALAVGLGTYWGNQNGVITGNDRSPSATPMDPARTADAGGAAALQPVVAAQGAPVTSGPALFEVTSWTSQPPNLAPLAPGESKASRQIVAIGQVKAASLPALESLQKGQRILLPLRTGGPVSGVVNLVLRDAKGWVRVGGALEDGAKGSFSLAQKGTTWGGTIRHVATRTAYVLETEPSGVVTLVEKPLGSVVCEAIPRRKPRIGSGVGADAGALVDAPSGLGASVLSAPPPMVVPELDSLPSSAHVVYLDFDGETVSDPDWYSGLTISAQPSRIGSGTITAAHMTEVWKRVSEDMRPFNIAVTTIPSRYTDASPGQRMRCIITSTDAAAPGAGGVAFLRSYDKAGSTFSDDVPCWAFTESYYNPDDISGTVSHEIGHTFGLSHDGKYPDDDNNHIEYYSGHGTWGPLMGTTYDRAISQWSKGEYANASNLEDDLTIISSAANGFFARSDDAPDSVPATVLANSGAFNQTGVITPGDQDLYSFVTPGGPLSLTASPAAIGPNLDILLELRNAGGVTVIKNANPAGVAKAAISQTLAAGTYVIAVRASGSGTASTGYTTYGSLGEYTLGGTFPAVPDTVPTISTHPLTQAVAQGTKVTLTVAAVSNTPPTYQWTKDNVNLTGQTKSTLVITSAQPVNQGEYRCIVSNTQGATPSDPATLTINFKPVFTLHPVAKSTQAGTAVALTAAASGTPTVQFQWQRNLVDIPAATSATLTLNDPQWANAGSYRCIATNAFGSAISKAATLTVVSKPVILVQPPVTFLAPLNGATSVGLTAAGTGKLSYQWYKGTTLLPGKTAAALSLTGITAATAGVYHCEVKNSIGTTVSDDVNVVTQDTPVITRDLANATVARNSKRTLSITAVGSPVLKYEWRKDGIKIPGATASLVVTATADVDYQVIVTNTLGMASSAVAHLTVHDVPKILSNTLGSAVNSGDPLTLTNVTKLATKAVPLGGVATFTVVADGTPGFSYQWKKNNLPIGGQTADMLTLNGLTTGDAASYSVTVSNAVGSVTSLPVKLTLQTAPSITEAPLDATVDAFYPATFTVKAAGTATLKYQWQKGMSDIPGATAATYKITSAQTASNGLYRVRVSNAVGSVYSAEAQLTVNEVLAPTVTTFSPQVGRAGHYVRLLGTNLNWTTAVSFRNSASAVVKAAFVIVSPTELLVTVPAGAASSAITVTTRGGVASTVSFFAVTSVNDTNDNFSEARVIPGAGGNVSGSNYDFAGQSNEPRHAMPDGYPDVSDYDPTFSAWFEWTPTVSGSYYVNTAGSAFDTRVAVYSGSSLGSLVLVGYDDDEDYDYDIYTSKAYVVVEAGTTYHIAVDGFSYTVFSPFGPYLYEERGNYVVGVSKIASSMVVASSSQGAEWATQGPVRTQDNGAVTLGGEAASEPALAWLSTKMAEGGALIHSAMKLSFSAPAGSADTLGLTGYGSVGQPLFGLIVHAGTGSLSTVDALGLVQATGQTLIPGESYDVDLYVDPAARTWGACLNGTWVARDLALPPQGEFADFAAQWLPGSGPHSRFTIHTAELSAEVR